MNNQGLGCRIWQNKNKNTGKKIIIWRVLRILMLNIFTGAFILTSLWGCVRSPEALTPEQRVVDKLQEQAMVRDVLESTSPRGLNNLPKAVPEFRARLRPQCAEEQQ